MTTPPLGGASTVGSQSNATLQKSVSRRKTGLPLPPFGRDWLKTPTSAGAWVSCGSKAWEARRVWAHVVMVCPPDEDPAGFGWPVEGLEVLLVELGRPNTPRLEHLGLVLLDAGAELVRCIRAGQRCFGAIDHETGPVYRRTAVA